MSRPTNAYPEWVEKYRTKGRTIRKVKNGYALYHCTSHLVPGLPYPKSEQEYLGMITEKDGFIPKKSKKESRQFLEYGLSHLLWANFRRDLLRSMSNGTEEAAKLAILQYIFGSCSDLCIQSSWLTAPDADIILQARENTPSERVARLCSKLGSMLEEKIPDEAERTLVVRMLMLCVVEKGPEAVRKPDVPEHVMEILGKYGLRYPE